MCRLRWLTFLAHPVYVFMLALYDILLSMDMFDVIFTEGVHVG